MKVLPPERRRCEECLNTMTLNLFRLNSPKCRYCQDGLSIPQRLLEEKPTETASEKYEGLKEIESLKIEDESKEPRMNIKESILLIRKQKAKTY